VSTANGILLEFFLAVRAARLDFVLLVVEGSHHLDNEETEECNEDEVDESLNLGWLAPLMHIQ